MKLIEIASTKVRGMLMYYSSSETDFNSSTFIHCNFQRIAER